MSDTTPEEDRANAPNVGFGVEIECAMPRSPTMCSYEHIIEALNAAGIATTFSYNSYQTWSVGYDGSTHDGAYFCPEIRTRILRGQEGLDELKRGMDVLKGLGAKGGIGCGMHTHISHQDLTPEEISLWHAGYTRYALCLDQIVARWRYVCGYGSTSLASGARYRQKTLVKDLRKQMVSINKGPGFSLRNETVEVRLHQSTLDSERATQWVKLMLALRERSIKFPYGSRAVRGDTDASFRWFLMAMGLDKPTRAYWMAQRKAYAEGINEDVPPGDVNFALDYWRRFPAYRAQNLAA